MRLLSLIGAALILLAAHAPAYAASDDVFVVPRVPVQATGATATEAKDAAQSSGRRRAMDILLRRLTAEEDWGYLPTLATGAARPAAATTARPRAVRRRSPPTSI